MAYGTRYRNVTASEGARKLLNFDIPRPYSFLLEPAPYKITYGGRYGLKDWSYARCILLLMCQYTDNVSDLQVDEYVKDFEKNYGVRGDLIKRSLLYPHRVLCVREIQDSIKDSVHALLKDQIEMLGLAERFRVKDDRIERSDGGGLFWFTGLYRNSHTVKSKEGITIGWVVEAEQVSDDSWKYFCPTVRADESEKWISFNTRYEDDPTYQRFVVTPPEGAVVKFYNSFDFEFKKVPERVEQGLLSKKDIALLFDSEEFKTQAVRTKYITRATLLDRKSDYARRPGEAKNTWGGEPLGKGRKLYSVFNEQIHVKEFDRKWMREFGNFFMSCDPAQHYYPACIWGALLPCDGGFFKYIYSEYPTFDDFAEYFCVVRKNIPFTGTLSDLAREFYLHDGKLEYGFDVRQRFIDTRFAKGSGAGNYFSNKTGGLVQEFAKKENGGISFNCPLEKYIDAQYANIIKDLEFNTLVPISAMNQPLLFIDPSCKNLILTLRNHRLEDDSEAESPKHKDFSDALKIMYAGMQDYKWRDPHSEQNSLTYHGCGVPRGPQGWQYT